MKRILLFAVSSGLLILLSCKKDTAGEQNPRCDMKPEAGPCMAAFVRYYYDKKEKKCKEFIWGGCGEFPFETMEECEACKCR